MTEEKIDATIKELKEKFEKIKKMGYIESTSKGRGNIGLTFEKLLGKENDNFQVSDYNGVEIKAKHGFSKTYITLFSLVPSGSGFFETKRLRDKFGYKDIDFPNVKVLNKSAWAKYKNELKSGYKISQEVDYENKKIYLCVYDKNDNLIDKDTFWYFSDVKETLFRKMNVLALIKAWPKRSNKKIYYRYYDIEFYKLKDFNTFLNLINRGQIRIDIQLGVFKSGSKIGQEHDHGITFGIKECDLLKLYDKYDIKDKKYV